ARSLLLCPGHAWDRLLALASVLRDRLPRRCRRRTLRRFSGRLFVPLLNHRARSRWHHHIAAAIA
ncbi:MAG: hypothetical protein ACYCZC_06355, partial [Acidithiobacillus sp.]